MNEMESKLYGSVVKRSQSTDEKEEIKVGDVVAAYLSFWNKWVRGEVKEITDDGRFYVWAVDYGVPMVLNLAEIIKLPLIYAKMNSKMPRIHVGGLINCIPVESTYDLEKDKNVLVDQTNWSKKAIEIMQKAISSANCLKFEETKEIHLMDRTHYFGHLKCQRPDGTWIDLNKSLCNAFVANNSTINWLSHVNRLDSIRQPEWKTVDGTPLHVNFVVLPISREQYKILCESSAANNQANGQKVTKANIVEGTNSIDESDSKINNSNTNNTQPIQTTNDNANQGQASNTRSRSRPYQSPSNGIMNTNRNWSNHRVPQMNNMNQWSRYGYGSQFTPRWHSNGKLQNQSYRKEVEFFESSFCKPTTPKTPIEQDDSTSTSDDSNDEPNEKQTMNSEAKEQTETKQSDSSATITSQNAPADDVATETDREETATINSTVNQQESNKVKDAS